MKSVIQELAKTDGWNLKNKRTLDRYLHDGLSTAVLCGAGSFYMLILMACSRIRPEVRNLNGPMCGRVAKLIRCPPSAYLIYFPPIFFTGHAETAIGRKVTRHIIPAIAHLRQLYPISLTMILPMENLKLGHLVDEIDCQDIRSSDDVFDSFHY